MSGILGLVETELLFANSGAEQNEIFRILQALVGIGSLRVVSRICRSPCYEQLHQMYGIQPPESVEARDFWLNQPSWTVMGCLGMTQEDTSYHKINQGSGPQLRILWSLDKLLEAKEWWADTEHALGRTGLSRSKSDHLSAPSATTPDGVPRSGSVASRRTSRQAQGDTPNLYLSRRGSAISEGTTDKWFLDRWQCEVLAVAAKHQLSILDASEVLTVAYFGRETPPQWHLVLGAACSFLSAGTFAMAHLTDWSWTIQFVALSCVGYFANRTACLRAWKFAPAKCMKRTNEVLTPTKSMEEEVPILEDDWPDPGERPNKVFVQIAVQASGFCSLKGIVSLSQKCIDEARTAAQQQQCRWKSSRDTVAYTKPYDDPSSQRYTWLSYEIQTSWFGLVTSVEPDNLALRSTSVIIIIINGVVLLIMGFGGTIKEGWNAIVLGVYLFGVVVAVLFRGRSTKWTMPEFAEVDLTKGSLTPAIKHRLLKLKNTKYPVDDGKITPSDPLYSSSIPRSKLFFRLDRASSMEKGQASVNSG
jgi:hypothetical protein